MSNHAHELAPQTDAVSPTTRFKGPSTLRARIFWSIVPIFLVMFGLFGAISFQQQRQLIQRQFIRVGEVMVSNLAYSVELGVLTESVQNLESSTRGVQADADVAYVFIYGDGDQLLHKGGQEVDRAASESLELSTQQREHLLTRRKLISRRTVGTGGQFHEFIAAVVSVTETLPDELLLGPMPQPLDKAQQDENGRAIGFVRLGLSLRPLEQSTKAFVTLWATLMGALVILSTLAIYFLSRRVTEPIKRLTNHAEMIAHGDLDQPIPIDSRDEIGQLAASFNDMARALKGNIDRKEQLLAEVQDLNRTLEDRIRRRTVELEERTEALEVAGRHKSEFLAKMSHELRTPLNAIIGYSEMLEEEAEDTGLQQFVPDLQKIHASGKHLLGLINDVLDLAKIEAGRIELFFETLDVRTMVHDLSSTIDPLVQKNGNTLNIECTEDVGEMYADQTRIRQCLFNLLSNACKFTKNGTISLEATRQMTDGDPWIHFRVTDTGIGMSQEQMDNIFDAFQQAKVSTTREYGGTGLGLSICRQFSQMMGGDVDVESELGKGSTFTVRLPADTSQAAEKAKDVAAAPASQVTQPEAETAAVEPSPASSKPLALVIDDDNAARDLMTRHLTKEKFDVKLCDSGREAIEFARTHHPDLITLDVVMPGMDGWAVLKALKNDPTTQAIPVIMVTIVHDRNMGYALGASEYITKPVEHKRLVSVLRRYHCAHPERCRNLPGGAQMPYPVLLIEDDTDSRRMLRRILEKEGWSVTEAENGKVGLERVAESRPRVILLDLMMPEMDGFEFMLKLRKTDAWRNIPVIVLTAKDVTKQDRQRLSGYVERIFQKGEYTRDELMRDLRDFGALRARAQRNGSCLVCDADNPDLDRPSETTLSG